MHRPRGNTAAQERAQRAKAFVPRIYQRPDGVWVEEFSPTLTVVYDHPGGPAYDALWRCLLFGEPF